ncbi:MAG: response regulator [Provencibacterium sp.]|jgi:hemerythrin-like metal-binding protein|nr:response regulator [Provencibacterium sp.]
MDAQFVWKEEYKIGVDIIDKEHERLFKIINKLFELRKEEKDSQRVCREGIKFFKGHTVKHFADEEAYMASIAYGGLERHRLIHQGFRENTLPVLEQELERTGYSPDAVTHFLGVCAGWLVGHTLTEDLSITGKYMRKWEALLPEEELDAMKKVIVQLVFDMFHLESQLISDAYNGEKFGRGVYYRLVYGTKQDEKKQEILLVFEEKLLVNTVGKVMGLQTNKLDNMLVHAARYMAQQFVGRMMEHFPVMESYELTEENLLTYEQFQKAFENKKLQVSLLFNTGGSGYFAYCAIAPQLLENGIGTPINMENALDEVEEYLRKREEQKKESSKPKVLIVDDSATILQGMKRLLGEDYEVALAESGIAAIRTITLNPPDLVLLDYEMPVCDGRQTLEMLRSDQAFADTPVIFLTGRRDPESMIKVMPLKPAGYLLKNSKPADLKKEIDNFFEKKKG